MTGVRAVLFGALAYFILPSDVIPHFLAGVGYTDDTSVLPAAVTAVQANLRDVHRDKARAFLKRTTAGYSRSAYLRKPANIIGINPY